MKILIGYDGSEFADAALNDLQMAGLPEAVEAMIVTVADVFIPPPIEPGEGGNLPDHEPAAIRRAHERAAHALVEARARAGQAGRSVARMFPRWTIAVEAYADSPAWALVQRANEWQPDLVVVGSRGDSSWGGRLILGSVAQRVLHEASCSVRVARGSTNPVAGPVRILIGLDGTPDSLLSVDAVAARHWPAGTEARIVVVLNGVVWVTGDPGQPSSVKWVDGDDEEDHEWVRSVFTPAEKRLTAAGLATSMSFPGGRPKRVLVEEAETWSADSIFVGAKGMRGVDRFLLGSVAAAVAARASCSVEVVRPKLVK